MILVYCVVGVAILIVLALSLWFCCTVKANWCIKVEKVVHTREHVHRSKRPLVTRTPAPRSKWRFRVRQLSMQWLDLFS